jgi:hypothetical protein
MSWVVVTTLSAARAGAAFRRTELKAATARVTTVFMMTTF